MLHSCQNCCNYCIKCFADVDFLEIVTSSILSYNDGFKNFFNSSIILSLKDKDNVEFARINGMCFLGEKMNIA
jgi:hypothetical protein